MAVTNNWLCCKRARRELETLVRKVTILRNAPKRDSLSIKALEVEIDGYRYHLQRLHQNTEAFLDGHR